MKAKLQILVDVGLSLGLFLVLLLISDYLGHHLLGRKGLTFQSVPFINKEGVVFLWSEAIQNRGLEGIFGSQEGVGLEWLQEFRQDAQLVWLSGLAFLFLIIVWALRYFRTSIHRHRIELVAEHTLEASFVLTTLMISLSPFLAWAYHRWFFPSWRLHLGRDHLLEVLYPILINELVVVLALTTLLAGFVVGILLILDPEG